MSWMGDPDRKSNIPIYGTCRNCWASGPAFKECIECKDEPDMYGDQCQYLVITCGMESLIINSQRMAEKLGKPHETAKANRIIHVVGYDGHDFNFYALRRQIEAKHEHIKDD
jgi:hypothetical protein